MSAQSEVSAVGLGIPDAVADAAAETLLCYPLSDTLAGDAAYEVLQACGPGLVAAELRRIADEIFDRRDDDNAWWFEDLLRARADELDPPAGRED